MALTASKTETWTMAIFLTAGGVPGSFDAISAALVFASVTTSACAYGEAISITADRHAVRVLFIGSDHARRALDWLTNALALLPSTRLRFVGVAEPLHYPSSAPGILGPTLGAVVAAVEAERRAALEAKLSATAKTVKARLPAIETAVLTGAPADMIVGDVERSGADLVVLGARGLGGRQPAAARKRLGGGPEPRRVFGADRATK